MAFKKIPPPSKPEPIPEPDPNQRSILDEIAERQAENQSPIKWNGPEYEMELDVMYMSKGQVFTLNRFDPFGENEFVLFLYQNHVSGGAIKVYLLNQDLSPQIDHKGNPIMKAISSHSIKDYVCSAHGKAHNN